MERQEALRLLNASTAFEFLEDKVVIRDERLLAVVAELRSREGYAPKADLTYLPYSPERRAVPRLS